MRTRLHLLVLSSFAAILFALCCGCGSVSHSASMAPTPTPSATPTPTPGFPTPTPTPSPSPGTSPSPTPSPTPTAAASRFVYGIESFEASGGFFAGAINPANGQISLIPGSPFPNSLGQNIVIQIVADPRGRFLYSLNLGASSFGNQFGQPGIGAYAINPANGALAAIPNGQLVIPSIPNTSLTIDGAGRFLYQPDGSTMDVYSINQSNGILSKMASSAPAVGNFTAASPNGQFLFNDGNGLVEALAINSASGQLSLSGAPVSTGGSGGPMTVSPDGRFLYVANSTQGNVTVFNIGSNGALSPAAAPFPTDTQAESMSLVPDGRFLYMVFGTPQQSHVNGYSVSPATGAFAAIPGAFLNNATSINVDASGRFAYVSQSQLVSYSINPATGALNATSQTAQPISDQATDVIVTP